MATCYRHPNRETGVSCSNCGNPICPDCMTATPVGMRCPDCAGQRTQVRTLRSLHVDPIATYVIIGICLLMFLGAGAGGSWLTGSGGGSSTVFNDFALYGPSIAINHEYWRLVTSGFLHSGLLLIGFNMYILYWLGTMLEPSLGHARFVALYLASLISGSFGALLLSPDAVTVGASGAVFGLMGAAFVIQRARGMDAMQSIGPIILINLAIGFIVPNISIGGHLGGLIGGGLAGLLIERLGSGRRGIVLPIAVCVAIAAVAAVAAVVVADRATTV
jgi:membrane associated rhomboid family serine protease